MAFWMSSVSRVMRNTMSQAVEEPIGADLRYIVADLIPLNLESHNTVESGYSDTLSNLNFSKNRGRYHKMVFGSP